MSVFKQIIFCAGVISVFTLCSPSSSKEVPSVRKQDVQLPSIESVVKPTTDTTFSLSFRGVFTVKTVIKYAKKTNGKNILMLHGFNLPAMEWCQKTSFCQQALDSGYTLIIPDFLKTTYQYQFYKETIAKYRIYPTRQWMLDTLIPHLQKNFRVLLPDSSSFTAGISTGARGAVLLGADRPAIFAGIASLSGDFDQTEMKGEPIYTGYYGPYEKHKDRWTNVDNPMRMVDTWTVPCFLAHGMRDKVSPASQTMMFSNALKKRRPTVKQTAFFPATNGHDYVFWSLCTPRTLKFFWEVKH